MKVPLQYQRTEYDCGPTSVLNALSYLFHRDQVPPAVLKYVMLYCLDSYNSRGDHGKSGTSYIAMMFLSNWLNQYGKAKKFPIRTEYLTGSQVNAAPHGALAGALQQGGAVVARVIHGSWHYVLLTGYEGEYVTLWDPYYRVRPFRLPADRVEMVHDAPTEKNRRVHVDLLNATGTSPYALGDVEGREAVLVYNTTTRRSMEKTIEYFI